MSKLWPSLLIKIKKAFNYIGDHSGCHQLPERSFVVRGYIFPLCARCCGVALGHIAAILWAIFGSLLNIYISVIFVLIMGADWFVQKIKIKESTNIRRFITGILGGFGVFMIYFNIIKMILYIFI